MKGFVLRRLQPHAQVIRQRYAAGESFEDLAEHFECGWGTIRRFLISHDVPLRQEPRRRKLDSVGTDVVDAFHSGAAVNEIAARFEVQPQTVRSYLMERGALVPA
jgi:DNA-binding NarL/FixJ family response regulator